ncbi:MAG: SLBB domain-containing protein [Gammaproteobacteria bacterium]
MYYRLLALLILCFLPLAAQAQDMPVSPEQLELLRSLTPEQREALLSGDLPQTLRQEPLSDPTAVQPRSADTSSRTQNQTSVLNRQNQNAQPGSSLGDDGSPQQDRVSNSQQSMLEPFGYELFAGTPTTFAPATDIPVPANYIMGPGDTVIIQLYGQENATYELVVTREGSLLFPEIGPLAVAGLTFDELRNQINEVVSTQLIGQRVAVTLGALRSIRIFVLGEAYQPGSYTVSALSTMTNALFVSGGITEVGSLRNVQLRRQGETVSELDLYDLLLRGDTSADVRLMPDDVLFIPPVGDTVGIAGEVIRPAIYELREEETVLEAVMLAGGTLPTAYPQASRIERIDVDGSRTLIDVDISSPTGQIQQVVNGDVIRVSSILDRLENVVLTEGHLQRPGGYQWQEGMRVSDVIPSLDALLPNPDTNYALIIRETPPTSTLEVLQINLAAAVTQPGTDADLLLQPRDRVITFAANGDRVDELEQLVEELNAQARFERPASVVAVNGNVSFPGSYPLVQGMTIGDLIDSASGLLENTDTSYSVLIRRRDSRGTIEALNAVDGNGRSIDFARLLQPGDQLYVFDTVSDRSALLEAANAQLRSQADPSERSKVVRASGRVRFPGDYPLFPGMTVSDLINASGGFTESALTTKAELTRSYIYDGSGREVDHLTVDLTNTSSLGLQMALEEFDNLVIRQLPNWTESEYVQLTGEVVSPGTYSIAKGDTLSSVLARAGGLTDFADPNASVLLRAELRERERELLAQYRQELQSDIAAVALEEEDSADQSGVLEIGEGLLEQVEEAEPLGRLVVDLSSILSGSSTRDVIARNGDQLFIPRTRQEISILGEVNYPTSHVYDPTLSVRDYIDMSGGLSQRADAGRTYIIKANGSVVSFGRSRWFFEREAGLGPGDSIVVPFDIEPTDYLVTWSSVSQILFNLATSVLAIQSVNN